LSQILPAQISAEVYPEMLYTELKNRFLEKDCDMHPGTNIPDEGVVFEFPEMTKRSFKLKSNRFIAAEDSALDKGEASSDEFTEE
jgi:hypothetical protein